VELPVEHRSLRVSASLRESIVKFVKFAKEALPLARGTTCKSRATAGPCYSDRGCEPSHSGGRDARLMTFTCCSSPCFFLSLPRRRCRSCPS
jgi:hypothetical protein